MKTLSIFIAGCLLAGSVSAQYDTRDTRRHHHDDDQYNRNNQYNNGRQYNNSIVTVTLNGNNNDQVYIDGRNYTPGNNRSGYGNSIQITDLQPGQHTIQVNNTRGGGGLLGNIFGSSSRNRNATAFNLRNGYDAQISVNANGRVQVRETRSSVTYQDNRNYRYNR